MFKSYTITRPEYVKVFFFFVQLVFKNKIFFICKLLTKGIQYWPVQLGGLPKLVTFTTAHPDYFYPCMFSNLKVATSKVQGGKRTLINYNVLVRKAVRL